MNASAPGTTARRNPLPFIFATVLIDTIGFGIIIPVIPTLITHLTGQAVNDAARVGGWLAFSYAVMQFICGPLIGNLSDRFGRRPVLLASLAAFAFDYTLSGFAPTIQWLFLGRIVAGITGASFSTGYAYIADVTPPEKRAQNFGLIGMAFGLGFIVGPAIGGLVGHEFGPRAPFFAAAGLAALNWVYGLLILPESLPRERRRPFEWRRANPIGALAAIRHGGRALLLMSGALFLWLLAQQALQGTWSFYTAYRFHWGPDDIGWSLAAVGLSAAIVQGGLSRVLIPKWGERRAIVIGMTSGLLSFIVYGVASAGWMMYAGIAVGLFAGLAYPSLQAMMSRVIPANSQGELQGAVSSMFSLATIIGPPLMTELFSLASGRDAPVHLPGISFLLAAGLTILALLVFRQGAPPKLP